VLLVAPHEERVLPAAGLVRVAEIAGDRALAAIVLHAVDVDEEPIGLVTADRDVMPGVVADVARSLNGEHHVGALGSETDHAHAGVARERMDRRAEVAARFGWEAEYVAVEEYPSVDPIERRRLAVARARE
jgi:hypothetical protein